MRTYGRTLPKRRDAWAAWWSEHGAKVDLASERVLLQIDKDSAQPRARVELGKEKEPVYAVDDIAGMLFLRTAPATLVGYRL